MITANTIRGSGNGGIRVWQSSKRHDGSMIADNRIEDTLRAPAAPARTATPSTCFAPADVIVRGNHIRNAAFSAIRGNCRLRYPDHRQ